MSTRPLLLALLPATLLAGCGGTLNRGLESVHQPVVSRADYSFDLSTDGAGLAPGEERRLAGWMTSLHVGYGDQLSIDDPAADPSARAGVAAEAARFGLLVSEDAPVTGAPVAPGTVRVVLTRMKASVPHCPDYTREGQPEFNSNTSSNFGCAAYSNLAAMVANPADLVRGEPGAGTTDPLTASRAVDAMRRAVPTGGGGTVVKVENSAGGGK